jgi:hypothetical protein
MVYHVGSDKKYLIILVVTRNVGNSDLTIGTRQ